MKRTMICPSNYIQGQGELDKIIAYRKSVRLPTCLKDLHVTEVAGEKIMAVARAACAEGETIHNMPFEVSPADVHAAILTADRLGAID